MSKKVFKDLLDSFERTNEAFNEKLTNSKKKKQPQHVANKLANKVNNNKKRKKNKSISNKNQQVDTVELYRALKCAQTKHSVNMKNIKRKFFKHDPDKVTSNSKNQSNKSNKSVFSEADFKNLLS